MWWQDLFEPATASMPTRHGVQTMRFAIRSANIWTVPAGDGTWVRIPRPAARLAFLDLLTSQGQQPPVVIDTSWLFVGHADEIMHVVRANNAHGWTLLVADPRLAERQLRHARARSAGAARLFARHRLRVPAERR